jgi:uncharacterized protein (TIGR01777 family)
VKIIIAGASGFIGSRLKKRLAKEGHDIVSLLRRESSDSGDVSLRWNPDEGWLDPKVLEGFDVVINLAGESISSLRWTEGKKKRILDSRVKSTCLLAETAAKLKNPPKIFLNASAVGYYGSRGEETLKENDSPGKGFLAFVCQKWEQALDTAEQKGIRTLKLRFGVVLNPEGGVLAKMLLPFKFGLGGILGNGEQYMSWISLEDLCESIIFLLNENSISGPVNCVSPQPVTNKVFTKELGKALHRPTFLRVPAPVIRLLFGEMGEDLFLSSQRALPYKLRNAGFVFRSPDLEKAFAYWFARSL